MEKTIILLVLSILLFSYYLICIVNFLVKLSSIKNKEDNGKILFVGSKLQIVFSIISILLVISGVIGLIIYKDIRFLGVIAITAGIIEVLLRNMLIGINSGRICINNVFIELKT